MDPLTVVQVTDTHLFPQIDQESRGCKTWYSCRSVLQAAVQHQPDILLLTGDLAHEGELGAYEQLAQLVEPLAIPTYALPGNHDRPQDIRAVFPRSPVYTPLCFEQGGWQFILLNSFHGEATYGEGILSELTLSALKLHLLEYRNQPTLIAVHHHAIATGIDWLDQIQILNGEALHQVIRPHPQVKMVICGHVHLAFAEEKDGIWYYGTPATCKQVEPPNPSPQWDLPGFRTLTLHRDGRHHSEVHRIPWPAAALGPDF